VVRGQAAAFALLLGRAHIPATLRITAGTHDWRYAIAALADAASFLADGWDQAAAAHAGRRSPGR
jgi:S-formylglutathione hydrolase FrmB